MKKHTLIPVVLGGLMGLSLSTQAQDREPGEASGQNIREALIKKFDKNGDGKLDEKERPTREQLQEFFRAQLGGGRDPGARPGRGEGRPGGRPGEGRPDGRPGEGRPGGRPGEGRPGGRPGEGGRGGGLDREGMRAAMLKKFDKNGDGRLDEDERPSREEMQEFFRSQFGGGRPGEGRPGGQPGEGRPGEGRPGGRGGEGGRGGGFPGGRGGFRPPANPLMTAIDTNKDGVITAEEMKNAAKALATLDKNKNGKLDQDELRPQFGGGRFGRPGGGDRPGGGNRPDSRRPGGGDRPDFRRPGGDRREGDRPGGDRRPPRKGDQPRPKRSDA